jgi:hypothetical protein
MILHGSFFVKGCFDLMSKKPIDIAKNQKSTLKYFERLQELLDQCDEYTWEGEDPQWAFASATTNNKKLQNLLMNEYYFNEEDK